MTEQQIAKTRRTKCQSILDSCNFILESAQITNLYQAIQLIFLRVALFPKTSFLLSQLLNIFSQWMDHFIKSYLET